MKKEITITICFFFISSMILFAQKANVDKVIKLNGEEMLGTVTEIGETYIKFIYKGESLSYTVKTSEINKIQFASGRVEFFTESPLASSTANEEALTSSVQAHHNQVAVLPFDYMNTGGGRDDKMGLKVQSDCYTFLKKRAKQFNIQDPMTTNAILVKSKISLENLTGLTPQEMANLLGVEYVVYGSVVISQTGVTSSSSSFFSGKSSGSRYKSSNFGTSSATANFNTSVDMKIYTDEGQNVYSNTHDSFWPNENAYEITLQYLIKRTPLYSK